MIDILTSPAAGLLAGLPCEMPATATEPEPDDRQGDFWRTP